jgi:hypothetical protein
MTMRGGQGLLAVLAGLMTAGLIAGPTAGRAQCILANPSFEVSGSGGATFAGWNQFGPGGSTSISDHGQKAARLEGQITDTWALSAFWQIMDSAPGESWEITGHVQHPAQNPLSGACLALVNVEWRDAEDALISYASFLVADADSPTDQYLDFSLLSEPAPSGTVTTRLLVSLLQSPDDPPPTVYFDQVTFQSTTSPTQDEAQWLDFPGGRMVPFAGRDWRVKGPGYYGPGGNLFCNTEDCAWVDDEGRLHLTLQQLGGPWFSTEVVCDQALGYGDYVLTTEGALDQVDPQAVLGIFLWEYGPCYDDSYTYWNAFNEIDIEYSRWGNPANEIAQFVAQPYNYPGNIDRFDTTFGATEIASHAMRWLPDRVEYRVWRGGPADESPDTLVRTWTYQGPHVPRPEQPRMHLNLWKLSGTPADDQEVVFTNFTFVPMGGASPVEEEMDIPLAAVPGGRLFPAVPNPFNPQTRITFALQQAGPATLDVFDLNGRRVRKLLEDAREAGHHTVTWDGRSDDGRPLASGVYLVQLRGRDFTESRRVVLVK